jgi:geranylgeranyl pyrophosphate synthase
MARSLFGTKREFFNSSSLELQSSSLRTHMKPTTVYLPVPISSDRFEINRFLETLLCRTRRGAGTSVFNAMSYAVLGGGQRIRPVLSLRIGRLLGAPLPLTLAAAGAVELVHCASLIIDDLPCMDNSPFRRNRPAAHVEFGESTAILAAFGLVALAARSVLEVPCVEADHERAVDFQLALLRSLDCCGLIAGQAMDLENAAAKGTRGDPNISDLKTVPLFTLAVHAGSLVANENADSHALLSGFGREFGLAFQMSDDLLDGEEESEEPFFEKLNLLRALIGHFGSAAHDIETLIEYLNERASTHKNCQPER